MDTERERRVKYLEKLVVCFAGLAQLSTNSLDDDVYTSQMERYNKRLQRERELLEQEKYNEYDFNAS